MAVNIFLQVCLFSVVCHGQNMKLGNQGLMASAWMVVRHVHRLLDIPDLRDPYEEKLKERRERIKELRSQTFDGSQRESALEELSELIDAPFALDDAAKEQDVIQKPVKLPPKVVIFEKPRGWNAAGSDAATQTDSGHNVPPEMCCPIDGQPLVDPAIASDGHTYERCAIMQWLENFETSPVTGEELRGGIRPNYLVKQLVEAWRIGAESNDICCPVSFEALGAESAVAVVASDGHTYRREAVQSLTKSPLTREDLFQGFWLNRILPTILDGIKTRVAPERVWELPVLPPLLASNSPPFPLVTTLKKIGQLLTSYPGHINERSADILIRAAVRDNAEPGFFCCSAEARGTKKLRRIFSEYRDRFNCASQAVIATWLNSNSPVLERNLTMPIPHPGPMDLPSRTLVDRRTNHSIWFPNAASLNPNYINQAVRIAALLHVPKRPVTYQGKPYTVDEIKKALLLASSQLTSQNEPTVQGESPHVLMPIMIQWAADPTPYVLNINNGDSIVHRVITATRITESNMPEEGKPKVIPVNGVIVKYQLWRVESGASEVHFYHSWIEYDSDGRPLNSGWFGHPRDPRRNPKAAFKPTARADLSKCENWPGPIQYLFHIYRESI